LETNRSKLLAIGGGIKEAEEFTWLKATIKLSITNITLDDSSIK
jgi:hypothetical protein